MSLHRARQGASSERPRPYRESASDAKRPGARPKAAFRPASGHLTPGRNAMAVPFDQLRTSSGSTASWSPPPIARSACSPTACITQAACSRASAPMAARSSRVPSIPSGSSARRSCSISRFPTAVAEIDAAKRLVLEKNGQKDAYVRPLAWRGSEQLGVSAQNNKIHLAIATWEWPSYFDPAQRLKGIRLDLAEYRRPDPKTAPGACQGGRPLHDLHHLQAPRRAPRLCRRHDARLAGARRRVHRRQHLLHQGRQDPHPDRRLLPRRHHARDRDRRSPGGAASR